MIENLTLYLLELDQRYPALQIFILYLLIFCIGIFIVAILYIFPKNTIRIASSIGDKILSFVIVIAFVIWVIFCIIFVFPFHCYKNRHQLFIIRYNKKTTKK